MSLDVKRYKVRIPGGHKQVCQNWGERVSINNVSVHDLCQMIGTMIEENIYTNYRAGLNHDLDFTVRNCQVVLKALGNAQLTVEISRGLTCAGVFQEAKAIYVDCGSPNNRALPDDIKLTVSNYKSSAAMPVATSFHLPANTRMDIVVKYDMAYKDPDTRNYAVKICILNDGNEIVDFDPLSDEKLGLHYAADSTKEE